MRLPVRLRRCRLLFLERRAQYDLQRDLPGARDQRGVGFDALDDLGCGRDARATRGMTRDGNPEASDRSWLDDRDREHFEIVAVECEYPRDTIGLHGGGQSGVVRFDSLDSVRLHSYPGGI